MTYIKPVRDIHIVRYDYFPALSLFSDVGIRIICYTSENQCFNLFELSFLSTDDGPWGAVGD